MELNKNELIVSCLSNGDCPYLKWQNKQLKRLAQWVIFKQNKQFNKEEHNMKNEYITTLDHIICELETLGYYE